MTHEQRQDYLDAVFHYGRFVYGTELMIGSCMNKGFVEWWGDSGPGVFGQLVRLRDRLDALAAAMQSIPEFRSQRAVLFVEGWLEKAFLDKMRESHSYSFLDLVVEVYEGKGNRRPKRIEMLLDRYVRHGYKVFIQGDADGKGKTIFDGIVKKGAVTPGPYFRLRLRFRDGCSCGPYALCSPKHGRTRGCEHRAVSRSHHEIYWASLRST